MTSMFDIPIGRDPVHEAKVASSGLVAARHALRQRLGEFLMNALTEDEFDARLSLRDVRSAIDEVVRQHLAGVDAARDLLIDSFRKDWRVHRHSHEGEGPNKFHVEEDKYQGEYTDTKMEHCVQKLKAQGYTEEQAIAICKDVGAGTKNPKTHPVSSARRTVSGRHRPRGRRAWR